MSEIKRWSVPKGTWVGVLSENANGAWVRFEDHDAAVQAAVIAERERCLVIVKKIQGCAVGRDGYLYLDPDGELVSRSRVETAIRWVKVK